MYIAYQSQNGILYASLATSVRNGKKVSKTYKTLGRVLDKDLNVFESRERGIFQYDVTTDTYKAPPKEFKADQSQEKHRSKQSLILDFGPSYVLDQLLEQYGFNSILSGLPVGNLDSLRAMLFYYLQCKDANCYALDWFEGDFARMLFPEAKLDGFNVSRLLGQIGEEQFKREFFARYFSIYPELKESLQNILIDSTGLPNAIHFPLTAVSTHNGVTSEEVRLTYVAQIGTSLPVYFQYDPGNVLDKSLLVNVIKNLEALGVNTSEIIFDAGYSSLENLSECLQYDINFITRLAPNLILYKQALEEESTNLSSDENAVMYSQRLLYISKVEKEIDGKKVFVYVGLDEKERHTQLTTLLTSRKSQKMAASEISKKKSEFGYFVLVSSRDFDPADVVGYYYKRQEIEQLFDVCKNYTKILPLRTHSEKTFRGHLMLTFMASVVLSLMAMQMQGRPWKSKQAQADEAQTVKRGRKKQFKAPQFNRIGMFKRLRNQKCNVYESKVVPAVAYKQANDVYSFFNIPVPNTVEYKIRNKAKVVDIKYLQN